MCVCVCVCSDEELKHFQMQVFQLPLSDKDVSALKKVLHTESEEVTYVSRLGVTMPGFLALFRLFIQKQQPQTLWTRQEWWKDLIGST